MRIYSSDILFSDFHGDLATMMLVTRLIFIHAAWNEFVISVASAVPFFVINVLKREELCYFYEIDKFFVSAGLRRQRLHFPLFFLSLFNQSLQSINQSITIVNISKFKKV